MVVEFFPVIKVPFALHASIFSSYRMGFISVAFKSFLVFRFKVAYITFHLFLFISFRIIRLGGVAKRVICFIFLSIILMIFLIIFVIFLIIFVSILIIITNIIFISIILICSLSIVFILFFISVPDMLVHTVLKDFLIKKNPFLNKFVKKRNVLFACHKQTKIRKYLVIPTTWVTS